MRDWERVGYWMFFRQSKEMYDVGAWKLRVFEGSGQVG